MPVEQKNLSKAVRRLRSVLKQPYGAKALEMAINDCVTKEKAAVADSEAERFTDKPIVAILIPSYGSPKPRMQMAVHDMRREAFNKGICQTISVPLMPNSVVHWQRNDLVAWLIKSGKPFTHVLFIDDDIVPPIDTLERMLRHNVDIVGAMCTFRRDPPIPNARIYDENTHRYAELRDWSAEGLLKIDAVGTGMMLISLKGLQSIADAWFQCKFEQARYWNPLIENCRKGEGDTEAIVKAVTEAKERLVGEWNQQRVQHFDKTANAQWFQFLPSPDSGVVEFGEDISFCFKALNFADTKVWVDTALNPEHLGEYGYTIADYKSQRRVQAERAKAEQAAPILATPDNSDLAALIEAK